MMTTTVSKLNERNYRQWAIEAETVLFRQGLWKIVTGEMRAPRPPFEPSTSGETPTTPKIAPDPRDFDYNFEPESTEPGYLSRFDSFRRDWERWLINNDKASGQITDIMEPTMQLRYREYKKPKELWDKIKADFETMVKLDGQHELEKLVLCNLDTWPMKTRIPSTYGRPTLCQMVELWRVVNPVFANGQIDRPVICRYVDRSDKMTISDTGLGIDRWRLLGAYLQSRKISALA